MEDLDSTRHETGRRKSADQRSPTEGRKPNGDVGWIVLGGFKSGQKHLCASNKSK